MQCPTCSEVVLLPAQILNMPNGCVDPASIANELACDKAFIQGTDRQGRPVLIIQVGFHAYFHVSVSDSVSVSVLRGP